MNARSLFLALLFLTLASSIPALGQRGGRDDGSRRRSNDRRGESELSYLKFQERLWFGAGGNLGFQGGNGGSFTQIGLTPQVGYKFTEWLSAGPRFGMTLYLIKGLAAQEGAAAADFRRYSLIDYTVGGFVRARYRQFYVQTELNVLSREFPQGIRGTGVVLIDDNTNNVVTSRQGDEQLQIGLGYAPPTGGGLGTDIGLYYNLFDDVRSFNTSPIELRFQLTFRY